MAETIDIDLLKRALGQRRPQRTVRGLYASKQWVRDLDITNELGGHTGCVNALSWAAGGGLLASGSDDTYLNIWDYNPTNLAKPFTLNTSVSTGHTANIFSVKFMPHSSDRTVVTCAGDSEVRVFDLEYGGAGRAGGGGDTAASSTRSRRFNNFFGNARWLSDANTNARVYRSHSDRAKRIVTESSPHLFLTCSEDGEVRQWDLRQPSSAYPAPHTMRRMGRFRTSYNEDTSEHVPPPLISYKKYQLDLNSISCSASQPHYIALGGAHLHCFLHDRRMLGRDISVEHGRPNGPVPEAGGRVDEEMREATKCVRRFAPNGKRTMRPGDPGHITACKISDARPNELIASWSGDHIYSFDIVKSPDARYVDIRHDTAAQESLRRRRTQREGKRRPDESLGSTRRRLRKVTDHQEEDDQIALQERNESVMVGITAEGVTNAGSAPVNRSNPGPLMESPDPRAQIARSFVRLRKTLFDFSTILRGDQIQETENSTELTTFKPRFTEALGQAASLLPEISEVIRTWSYPINPDENEVQYQNTLRRNRQASWRFVQAAGCLSAAIGGRLQTLSTAEDPRMQHFTMIKPAPREGDQIPPDSRFCYDFLKAILLWVSEGAEAVLNGFRKPMDLGEETSRFPIAPEDSLETLPDKLRSYLLSLADPMGEDKPIIDLDRNRFERDELRHVFESQHAAVQAFVRALAGIELRHNQGLSGIEADASRQTTKRIMDKGAAARFWILKVGRSLLMDASKGVTYSFVQHAFGGRPAHSVILQPRSLSGNQSGRLSAALGMFPGEISAEVLNPEHDQAGSDTSTNSDNDDDIDASANTETPTVGVPMPDINEGLSDHHDRFDEEEDEESDDEDDEDEVVTDEESENDDAAHPIFRNRAVLGRSYQRANVNLDVSYSSHTKVYTGHCNTRTVKDVNYFGLDDEYVVSGSDDGHFFIWDRKTSEIVNILEGDGEVVNVVQGHPYEPIIACSGIDSSVKIFGPGKGSRDRHDAVKGHNIANPGESVHKSLRFGRRRRRALDGHDDNNDNGEEEEEETTGEENIETIRTTVHGTSDDEPTLAHNGLRSRRAIHRQYQITTQNDVARREGVGDAIVTHGMLARFAAVLQRAEMGAAGQGFGGRGGTLILDDNCMLM